MRSEEEVEEFKRQALNLTAKCKLCKGLNPVCECYYRAQVETEAYEACIPRDFWHTKAKEITHNKPAFDGPVTRYCAALKRAAGKGYGLAFLGDNGVGKSMFISWVLMAAIRTGHTTYYTTMPQLDHDIKRGFTDREVAARLEVMLTSDFLAIDEMGKERHKRDSGFNLVQIERILKKRYDDSMPVLIATNLDMDGVVEFYGSTIGSILKGKYELVNMEPGDHRETMAKKMRSDMGYDK